MKKSAANVRNVEPVLFSEKSLTFLRRLKRNNERAWFDEHRGDYEVHLKAPCRAFVETLRPILTSRFPGVRVDSRSIHRINRDTRFSSDKSPYKTFVSFMFRDQRAPQDVDLGLYLGMDPTGLLFGAGIYSFSKPMREHFRDRVTTEPTSESFARALKTAFRAGYESRGKDLKKIPAGYDPSHPHAEYLLHNGLFLAKEVDMPKEFYGEKFAAYVARELSACLPFFEWMREMARSSPAGLSRFL